MPTQPWTSSGEKLEDLGVLRSAILLHEFYLSPQAFGGSDPLGPSFSLRTWLEGLLPACAKESRNLAETNWS